MTNQEKKKKIFDIFSQNLEWVKEHPSISFKPDFSNGYICPLCFEVFYEKDLDPSQKNHLTLEDVPPKSLGGKPLTLTCKSCNSKSGHDLDIHLLNKLLELDSQSFLPNSKSKAVFEFNGNKINGTVEVDTKGTLKFDFQTHRSNPTEANNFIKDFEGPKTIYSPIFNPDKVFNNTFKSPTFKLQLNQTSNERRYEVALLRIAYLLAYSTFGNGFYINGGLYKVREQILNPEKEILPKVFWINLKFPKSMEGVNIITLPKELRCFLVVFNLKTKSISRQFAIVLPGQSEPSIKVYDYILSKLCSGDGTDSVKGVSEHLPQREYVRNKDYTFASSWFWQEYTKPDYKPNLPPNNQG